MENFPDKGTVLPEIHGYVMTKLAEGHKWNGEFGSCFSSWLRPEDRQRSKDDLALVERLVSKMKKAELVAYLTSLGKIAYVEEKRRDLQLSAVVAQMGAWWPRKFVDSFQEGR